MKKNPNATSEEIEKERKKLNEKINPILEKAQARRNLENNINDMRRRMEDPNDPINGLSPDERKKINDCVNDAGDWMKKNPGASKKDNDQKLKEFLNKLEPYTNKSKKRKDLQDEANILRNRALDNNELANHLSEDEKKKKKILDAAKELLNWLENNPNASEKEIEAKKKRI